MLCKERGDTGVGKEYRKGVDYVSELCGSWLFTLSAPRPGSDLLIMVFVQVTLQSTQFLIVDCDLMWRKDDQEMELPI